MLGGLQKDVGKRRHLLYQLAITQPLIPATTKLKSFISLEILHTSNTDNIPRIYTANCVKKYRATFFQHASKRLHIKPLSQ